MIFVDENIKNITNIEELKKLGSIENIITTIEEIIKPIKIKATSYEELVEYIKVLQCKWIDFQDNKFFKNEESKYLFCLTEVDGKRRNEAIGLTDDLYDDKEKAKKCRFWFRAVVRVFPAALSNPGSPLPWLSIARPASGSTPGWPPAPRRFHPPPRYACRPSQR